MSYHLTRMLKAAKENLFIDNHSNTLFRTRRLAIAISRSCVFQYMCIMFKVIFISFIFFNKTFAYYLCSVEVITYFHDKVYFIIKIFKTHINSELFVNKIFRLCINTNLSACMQ